MRKSIFTQYLTAFLVIVVVCFSVLTVIVSSRTIHSTQKQKSSGALNTSIYITDYILSEARSESGYHDFEGFLKKYAANIQATIDLLSKNIEGMIIFIAKPDGTVLISTESCYLGKISDAAVLEAMTKKRESVIEPILLYSDMNGLFNGKYGMYVTPFIYDDNEYVGDLIVCFSAKKLDDFSMNVIRTIVLASFWAMIASFMAIYFMSEKITAPIKQMSVATKRFSAGKFDEKITVKGSDEIAELAAAFNSMVDSLSNLEQMRSGFLANVAHDLRTPMTSISGFIEGIIDGAIPPEKQPYYLELIAQEIKRLSRLVSTLLDLARTESGDRNFEKTPFDICETARLVLLTFENKIEAKHLCVEFDAPDDRLYVYSDKDAIHQVLYNLCDNAVKFSFDGGLYRIVIKDMGEKASVTIYNEGNGITPEDLPHVFDRFYKSDKSRGLDRFGVGLGLYIVKTICEALGEHISVDSQYGKYCSFTITLSKYSGEFNKKQNADRRLK